MDRAISIKSVNIRTFDVTIVGDTSLISNHFSDFAKTSIRDKQQGKARGPRPPKDPEKCFTNSIYWTEDKRPGFPASAIKKTCVSVCRFIDDLPMTQARGAFFVIGEILPIDGKPRLREDVVKLRSVADLRYRAEYENWSITLTIRHNPDIISEESVINLLELAGFHVGIGDWRPEKTGTHGMFHVKR